MSFLNPNVGAFEVSGSLLLFALLGIPKLNPPEVGCEDEVGAPKVKPFVLGTVVGKLVELSALSIPNLKLPAFAGMSTLNCNLELDFGGAESVAAPARGVSHATHLFTSDLF